MFHLQVHHHGAYILRNIVIFCVWVFISKTKILQMVKCLEDTKSKSKLSSMNDDNAQKQDKNTFHYVHYKTETCRPTYNRPHPADVLSNKCNMPVLLGCYPHVRSSSGL